MGTATRAPAGYSGTPLAGKLGFKPGMEVVVVESPPHYAQLVSPLPEGLRFSATASAATDIVHAFFTARAELAQALKRYRKTLSPNAAVWVSWPKKSARLPTDITEDVVREVALPLGFVDVKVCAVGEVWSGLKLVVRKELR
jgi:hypothetical protein